MKLPLATLFVAALPKAVSAVGQSSTIRGRLLNGPKLVTVWNNGSPKKKFPLSLCEGDCDKDKDCEDDLVCFTRDGIEEVPGCTHEGMAGDDYCTDRPYPTYLAMRKKNGGNPKKGETLGLCEGDCDDDDDCQEGLVCFKRKELDPVRGCDGKGTWSKDYCVLPEPTCENQADLFSFPKESSTCRGQIETVYFAGDEVCGPQWLADLVTTTSQTEERLSFEFAKTLNVDSIVLSDDSCSENIAVTTHFLGLVPGSSTRFGGELNATNEYSTSPMVSIDGECISALGVYAECSAEVAALNFCVPPTDRTLLMVPDSIAERVILFDEFDGSLVDKCFIDGNDDGFDRPVNAISVNDEVWISDQNADAIFRYTQNGVFVGILDEVLDEITGLGKGKTNGLENIRGIEFVEGQLYVTNGLPTTRVVVFRDGVNVGFFETSKVQDVLSFGGELYVTNNDNNADAINVYTMDGENSVLVRNIAQSDGKTSFDFLQQMTLRKSTGTLLVGGFSTPRGIYEFAPDGTILNTFREGAIVRAAYELGNGKILWSSGDGSAVLDISDDSETDVYSVTGDLNFRPSVQYIEPIMFTGL